MNYTMIKGKELQSKILQGIIMFQDLEEDGRFRSDTEREQTRIRAVRHFSGQSYCLPIFLCFQIYSDRVDGCHASITLYT
jgi:hypothetical protein